MAPSPKKEKEKEKEKAWARGKGIRRRPLLLRRAMLHSSACFFTGVLIGGFISTPPSDHVLPHYNKYWDWDWSWNWNWTSSAAADVLAAMINNHTNNYFLPRQQPAKQQPPMITSNLVVVMTCTELWEPERRAAGLSRTAHALRLVPPPLLWLVVEPSREALPTARLLRGAGVVYRHLTYKDNFTDGVLERHHQRNVALGHVEQHRLDGVLLFAGLDHVYDHRLFQHLREIRTFGVWSVATLVGGATAEMEGPVCARWAVTGTRSRSNKHPNMFAFRSTMLWDPTRWDRFPINQPDASQDSFKFMQRLVAEEYNKSRGMPDPDCSEIMVWRGDQLI